MSLIRSMLIRRCAIFCADRRTSASFLSFANMVELRERHPDVFRAIAVLKPVEEITDFWLKFRLYMLDLSMVRQLVWVRAFASDFIMEGTGHGLSAVIMSAHRGLVWWKIPERSRVLRPFRAFLLSILYRIWSIL